MSRERLCTLNAALQERILILDGAMGTMIQRLGFGEEEFRGEPFRDHSQPLSGNNDLLSLTQPEAILDIHRAYLEAGSDIIETNTFGATALAQADYGTQAEVYRMNRRAAELAVQAAEEWSRRTPDRPRFVAGALGPTNQTLSISPDVDNPAHRALGFDEMKEAYAEQARGLVDGGVDLLLVETIFDTLNAKAALVAVREVLAQRERKLPLWISVTVIDRTGRTLSGQTMEAFWTSVVHARPFALGINCGMGASGMRPYLTELARLTPTWLSCYPNAGLPDGFGGFTEEAGETAELLRNLARDGLVNIAGGCCGTTPDHIREIHRTLRDLPPRRRPPPRAPPPRFSGLEALTVRPESNLIMVGERTNVTGSRRFARLIREEKWQEALQVALQQARQGANVLDICLDDAMLDAEEAMEILLRSIASEPELARLPLMVDSSRWSVIQVGLRNLQGKGIVNSISLKEGEEELLRRAGEIRAYGAAAVVMAFDEEGQADSRERKTAILERSYGLLTERAGFEPGDLILDPGVLAVGTGLEEHREVALDFLRALPILKESCPGALLSGGVSNLSFAFRGNDRVREAMHAAFLFHARQAGLDMAIVNAGQLAVYDEIEPELRERVEDVLLNRRPDATERLLELAGSLDDSPRRSPQEEEAWRQGSPEERLAHALVHGRDEHVQADILELFQEMGDAMAVIQGPLMAGMEVVGRRFGEGRMFLPQVVKSARVMKRAVATLEPHLEQGALGRSRGRLVLATVKGDVHDIGKNILGVVLAGGGWEVIDLGVMVPAADILRAAADEGADLIGLSGLITPSLDEMAAVAREMERTGLELPLLIGGATTSPVHTAVRIAPAYSGPVVHVRDASQAAGVVSRLLDPAMREAYIQEVRVEQVRLREQHEQHRSRPLVSFESARRQPLRLDWSSYQPPTPGFLGRREVLEPSLEEMAELIDWTYFFTAWGLKGRYPNILDHPERGAEARKLEQDARNLLDEIIRLRLLRPRGVYGFWPAGSDGESIVLYRDAQRREEAARFPFLRQQLQKPPGEPRLCLADFVSPLDGPADHLGAFAVTSGLETAELARRQEDQGDSYRALIIRILADRLAEAFAEYLHRQARRDWGILETQPLELEDLLRVRYRGIRPAFGYPACPDHAQKFPLFKLLDAPAVGITLTESAAMNPPASVSGLYLAHPEARYFDVGRIARDQVEAYAAAQDRGTSEVEKWLAPRLGYEPEGQQEG